MKEHSPNFPIEKAMQLAKTPAGQQLLSMLQNADNTAISIAMALVAKGDLEGAKAALQQIANTPQVQQLLSQMEKR